MNDLCVQHHQPKQRRALDGLRLCESDRYWLEHNIEQLPGLHADLAGVLATTSRAGQRVSGTSAKPLPINPGVADCRNQISRDLTELAVNVAQRRGLTVPVSHSIHRGLVRAEFTDPGITGPWLLAHVDWIAAQPDTAQYTPPVMRSLVGTATRLLDPDRRLATGERCRLADDQAERCTGTIAMVQSSDETWAARCSVCGMQEAAPYLHERLAGRLVTIERAVIYVQRNHRLAVQNATIRSWAHRHRIVSVEQDGSVWYDLGSIHRYLTERERMAG